MRRLTLLLMLLLLPGCSGITPYEPRNNREEGLPSGLFSGPQGEFEFISRRSGLLTPRQE